MTDKILEKAQNLKKQIGELRYFLSWFDDYRKNYFEMYFGKINKKKEKTKLIFQSSTSSIVNGDYVLSDRQKERVLEILKEDLTRLEDEYERLGTEENED